MPPGDTNPYSQILRERRIAAAVAATTANTSPFDPDMYSSASRRHADIFYPSPDPFAASPLTAPIPVPVHQAALPYAHTFRRVRFQPDEWMLGLLSSTASEIFQHRYEIAIILLLILNLRKSSI